MIIELLKLIPYLLYLFYILISRLLKMPSSIIDKAKNKKTESQQG